MIREGLQRIEEATQEVDDLSHAARHEELVLEEKETIARGLLAQIGREMTTRSRISKYLGGIKENLAHLESEHVEHVTRYDQVRCVSLISHLPFRSS